MNVQRTFSFLKSLKKNNKRDWFQRRKVQYDEIVNDFKVLIDGFLHAMVDEHPEFLDLDPKDCIFRIYRDVRFSQDKSPYKTHLSAFLSPGGRKAILPGYYFHLEPGHTMLAAGWYSPPPEILKKLRMHVSTHGHDFTRLMNRYRTSLVVETFDKLSRVPKGFPRDHAMAEWLKHKHFILSKTFTDAEACKAGFGTAVIRLMKKVHPFCDYLKKASK